MSTKGHIVKRNERPLAFGMTSLAVLVGRLVASSGGALLGSSVTPGNQVRGKDLFTRRCSGCHSLETDKEGPRLHNVFGREAGSIASFKYSDGLKSARFAWDASSLDQWLTDTEAVVPDNNMDFHVPKADERADIIEFLRVSAGK